MKENLNFQSRSPAKPFAERHIFLIGFMGAGKTTTGQLLAQFLHRPFVDMDEELEKSQKKTISDIFAQDGEAFFRQAESSLLTSIINRDRPLVVATGGGVVEKSLNRAALKNSLTFFLDLNYETAWARLTDQDRATRPLAHDLELFKNRLAARRPLYLECGQVTEAEGKAEKTAAYLKNYILDQAPFFLLAEDHQSKIWSYLPMERIKEAAERLIGDKRVLILSDPYFKGRDNEFLACFNQPQVLYASFEGEKAKTLDEAARILELMCSMKLDRGDFLLSRGGGALTDLGAFCAGLYRRGLNLVLIPTTLLGAVDAAVGGKTAVNLSVAKNQVGHFYLPQEVWIDPWVMASLPEELLREGLTEAYKTALLFNQNLATLLERHIDHILEGDLPLLSEIIYFSSKAKAALVEKDFREEKGLRDILNLGHTLGHALESLSAGALRHGKAVAMGLACALEFSVQRFNLVPEIAKSGQKLCLNLCGGTWPKLPPVEDIKRLLDYDKKIRSGKLKFVALKAPNEPLLIETDSDSIISAALTALKP
ncbi:MAG: bifunctional shikimate kinase/3-dehydroquinate synthase [Deltaproteobacteria bacterium]|nr:bifunctional shikimate kinase/3-dehydroquinate synthase [Deltaproteobacteria bacterium]